MCGVFAMMAKESVTEQVLQALVQLQHRGQDAAGIYLHDQKSGDSYLRKNLGLVTEVFPTAGVDYPPANCGVGHVRYSTIGKGCANDAQPLCISGLERGISVAHNGNIVNYVPLREQLEEEGAHFATNCDVEVILHQLRHRLCDTECTVEDIGSAVESVFQRTQGAYSVVVLIEGRGLLAFRDPNGIRPLQFGLRNNQTGYAFASETSCLTLLGFDQILDVKPGEFIFIDTNLDVKCATIEQRPHHHCSFEWDYFAKPNAVLDGKEVYRARAHIGIALAEKIMRSRLDVDVVVPIPDTARPAAIALAQHLGVPLEEGFVKQGYVGRTFIMPTAALRKQALIHKLAPVPSVFRGKKVLLVDDSIVRGTVSKKVVQLARYARAESVYFSSTFPPIRFPCVYGVDFPRPEELIATGHTDEEICQAIGADQLIYNDVSEFKKALGLEGVCTACLTGEYPTGTEGFSSFQAMREQNQQELACKS